MKFNGIVGAGLLVVLIVVGFGFEGSPTRLPQADLLPVNPEPRASIKSFLQSLPREATGRKSTNVQTLQQLATVTYVGADNGQAVIWDEAAGTIHRLETSRPVFRAFGISLSRRLLLYSPLQNNIPSGVLLLEDLESGESTRLTDDLTLEATFSPDNSKVAYTFATGSGFGLASIDLNSKIKGVLVGHDVLPDYLQWDDSENGLLFFTIRNNDDVGELVPQRMSLADGKSLGAPLDSLPATFPKPSSYSSDREQSLAQIKPGHVEINYPFEVNSPDKTKKVCSSNLLGNNLIRLCGDTVSDTNLSTGQLLKITNYGIILRRFQETRTTTDFVDWSGNAITLAASLEVSFNLPMSPNNGSFVVTRSGTGYGSQSCTIVNSLHTGSLEFAFDMQKQSAGHHVIAAAEGLAMNPVGNINCNSCADLPNGCGGKSHCSTSQANGGWGNVVLIQHADTTWTRYAHLQANSVTVQHGASVCQGLHIGNQGGTGTSCGSFNGCGDHLHFQKQLSASGASVAVSFADAAVNPLRCISHTSGSAELSACSTCQNGTATLRNRDGGPPIHPPGSVLRTSSSPTVYLIDSNNRKRPITSASVLAQLYNQSTDARSSTNFTNWVITVGQDELDLYEQGGNLSSALPGNGKLFPDGKLISFNGQVSIVTGEGKRRPFSDGPRFQGLGYSFCNVVNVSQSEYNSYQVGPDVDAMPLLTSSVNLNPGGPYTVGQSITGSFTIKNVGYSPITFARLGIGGRFNSDPFDLSFETVTLSAGSSRNFNSQPPAQLNSPGTYNFFAAYQETNDHWAISVPAAPGVSRSRQINVENSNQLSTPTANPATNVTSNSFIANWTSINGANGYRLDVSTNSSFSTFVSGYQNRDVGNVLSTSVTGLAGGTTYFYRVRAYNSSNTSSNSNVISTITSANPGPSNNNFISAQIVTGMLGTVTGSNTGANKESGEPNHANNSGGASVWYRWQATVTSTVTFATTGSSFDTLLAAYTGSSVGALTLVTANDDFNGGVLSAITFNAQSGVTYHIAVDGFSGTTGNIVLGWGQKPAAPAANPANNVGTTSFTANWGSVAGASGYELDVSTSNTFSTFVSGYQNLDVGNVLSRNVTGLSADTTYFYRVRAYNSAGTSTNSNTMNVKTTGTVPPAPVANSATNITTTSLTANWSSATGATGYRVDVSTSNSFSSFVSGFQNLDVGNVLSRNVNGLSAGTTYFYRVRAYNSAGISANSNTISAAMPTQTFTISLTASPSNGGNVSGGGTFAAGSSRTVTATANSTHVFANWTEGGVVVSTSGSFTFVLNGNRTLVANFTAIPSGGNAAYDSLLRVPKCGQVGSVCDSGGLLNGRDTISGGPEPNQPNTLFNSCADNTGGSYHNDESVDRIRISTLDGGPFAPGKTIKIDVTVWAFSVTNDFLDLFYASDVNNPNWTFITTLVPSGTGSQVLSATFTIPNSGGVHAIRANFLFQGAALPCSGGANNFDDHDDLAFAVQQPSGPSWQPTVLTADQVELKSWKVAGRTFVYAKLTFPDAGYRVANWGTATGSGNAFSSDATIEKFTGGSAQVITSNAQIWDLGALAAGNYTFTFKNSGTNVKTLNFTVSSTPPAPNPIDDARTFVFWQYRDFLRRDPDGPGWDHWTNEITQCSNIAFRRPGETEPQCVERKRENTSAAFFVSPESQNIAYFVLRVYRGSLGRMPFFGGGSGPSDEFTRDAATVGQGIIVNNALDHNRINTNKQAFVNAFVARSDFRTIYDPLTNTQYVDKLFQTTGVTPSAGDRQALINGLNGSTETRASVLFKVVDGTTTGAGGLLTFNTVYGKAFYDNLFNAGFVQMEYFGYLQRDPDPGGYAFWFGKLNTFGDWVNAEMVKSFIKAPEYRARFGAP